MRVAIIGAGAAGLASARHVSANGYECDVLEMAQQLGGTWVYTDNVETDEFGYPVYSAMYKGLRTNLPKEIMGFPDFPIQEHPQSYLKQSEILDFLNMYAEKFNLKQLIKYNRMVTDIRPLDDGTWQITSQDKPNKTDIVDVYDVVMVCNGHYNEPRLPDFPGQEVFKGKQYHSRSYRSPENHKGQNILVVGAGPSGIDLALQLSTEATKVVFSHHCKQFTSQYPANVETRGDIRIIKEEEVEFEDGTCCRFDVIFYCTGYLYDFPFLHKSCGIIVDDNHIQPLYKHIIHIERPTMCFIGIPFNVCAFQMFDLQARFYVNSLNGKMTLPSAEDMKEDTEKDMQMRWSQGYTKRQAHIMGSYQRSYYADLAKLAKTEYIPEVIVKIRESSNERFVVDIMNFREDTYKIIDDENFIHIH